MQRERNGIKSNSRLIPWRVGWAIVVSKRITCFGCYMLILALSAGMDTIRNFKIFFHILWHIIGLDYVCLDIWSAFKV